jgi:hypothetical protein
VSIGETLAKARHRAGLSVAQVAEQTRIRPLIIRGIEAGDYSMCGGGSCTGEHICSIAEAVGADSGPLIAQYARGRQPSGPGSAASLDEPPAPPRPAWYRHPVFMLAYGVAAIMITISSVGYRLIQGPLPGPVGTTVAADTHASPLHITGEQAGHPGAAQAAIDSASSAPSPEPAQARPPASARAHTMAPVSAVAFGPDGRQGDDPHGAWLATDGHRRTAWHTRRYAIARFQTPGTGLLLDMGRRVTITAVRVTIGAAAGASFQIRIGDRPALADLRPFANSAGPGGIVRMTMGRPVPGRYVLVWFTTLPPGPAGTYQAAVHGIGVKARS